MTDDPNYSGYRDYLPVVANEDARFLLEKDKSYNGSWKRSGGRNAWFMCKRMIDRLVTMMAPPVPPSGWPNSVEVTTENTNTLKRMVTAEDIFLQVEARPGGEDGSVLAVIRDLRRYLMLVEADVMARGIIQYPGASAILEPDFYSEMAEKWKTTREEAKSHIRYIAYAYEGPEPLDKNV